MAPAPHTKHAAIRHQVRGSSLLLVGELISKVVNFAVQVLIVRYLSKGDYGVFAYVFSTVTLGEALATFGLERAIIRFLPIYQEKREYHKLFGTIILVMGTVILIGFATVLLVYGFQGLIAQSLVNDPQAVALLLILIILSPLQALDTQLLHMLAVFSSPRSILFRKHVMAPLLTLIVALLLVVGHRDLNFLAHGYLAAGVLSVAISAVILFCALRDQGLLQHFKLRAIKIPVREIFAFTMPLLASDLVNVVMNTMDAILLGHFRGTADVAALRAVQPAAKLNQLVLTNFGLLFTPLAARMFARNDGEGIKDLYRQNALWIAIISFPIFALTFSLARPLTVLLYGTRYEQSAVILALLSFGYYFSAALGPNGLTLKVFGKVRYIVVISILAAVINLGLNLLLIPRHGALGAALGTCGTLIAFNILKQAGLGLGAGMSFLRWRYLKVYVIVGVSTLGLLLLQVVMSLGIYVGLAFAALASLLVFRLNREPLNVAHMFPELLRFPLASRLFGARQRVS